MALVVLPDFNPNLHLPWRPDPTRDLRLRVFIPFERLFRPPEPLAVMDLRNTSFVDRCAESPLRFFKPSRDLHILDQILSIIDSPRLDRPESLATLSRYFEALSVQYESMASRHLNMDEDKMTLTIWSMMGFFLQAKRELEDRHPDLLALIEVELVSALRRDRQLFAEIYDYEQMHEKMTYLQFDLVELKIRKYLELKFEQPMVSRGGSHFSVWGMSAIANYEECRDLAKVKKSQVLNQREKLDQAAEIWNVLAEDEELKDLVEQSFVVVAHLGEIDRLESAMLPLGERIARRGERAKLHEPKRALQAIFEWKQLHAAIEATEMQLGQPLVERESRIQWLIVLREGLKTMATDRMLNISQKRSVAQFAGRIKKIRDYFEHPENYAFRMDHSTDNMVDYEEAIFAQLNDRIENFLKLMSRRWNRLGRFLHPHPSIDPKDAYATLIAREGEVGQSSESVLLDQAPIVVEFSDRIVDLRNQRIPANERSRHHFPSHRDQSKPWDDLLAECREFASLLPKERLGLLDKLHSDTGYRLRVQRKMAHITSSIKRVLRSEDLPVDRYDLYDLLLQTYITARETRNLNTHEIWRENILGIADAARLLGNDLVDQVDVPFNVDEKRFNLLFHSLRAHKLRVVDLESLRRQGFDLNTRDSKGRTLLHFIAEEPSTLGLELGLYLLQNGASPHLADCVGMRPLHYAAENGFAALADELIRYGAVVNPRALRNTPTSIAAGRQYKGLAWMIGNQRGDARRRGVSEVLEAIGALDLDHLESLIAEGIDVCGEFEGELPLVQLFNIEGADVELQLAIATRLVEAGANIDQADLSTGETPLIAAASIGDDPRIRQWFWAHNPDITRRLHSGSTALHRACACRFPGWVEDLLLRGAEVDASTESRETPLLKATDGYNQNEQIVGLLLAFGADPNWKGEYGHPLHQAAERGTPETVELLLSAGASPFQWGSRGLYYHKTPGQLAQGPVIQLLIERKMKELFHQMTPRDQRRAYTML